MHHVELRHSNRSTGRWTLSEAPFEVQADVSHGEN